MLARPWQALEIRQSIESKIHLPRRTAELVTLYLVYEIIRQLRRFDEFDEGMSWVNAG